MVWSKICHFDQTNIKVLESSNLIWNIVDNILPTRDNALERSSTKITQIKIIKYKDYTKIIKQPSEKTIGSGV